MLSKRENPTCFVIRLCKNLIRFRHAVNSVSAIFYSVIFAKEINCTCHKLIEVLASTSIYLRASVQLKSDMFQNIRNRKSWG